MWSGVPRRRERRDAEAQDPGERAALRYDHLGGARARRDNLGRSSEGDRHGAKAPDLAAQAEALRGRLARRQFTSPTEPASSPGSLAPLASIRPPRVLASEER